MKVDTPTQRLLTHKELAAYLGVSTAMIDKRLQRYPKGRPHEFPVEYIGSNRRYDPLVVRAWFAAEAEGFGEVDIKVA